MGDNGGEKPPASLEGLLKFSVQNSTGGSREAAGPQAMCDDDKAWLNDVLANLADNNPVKAMAENIKIAAESAETDDDLERQETALENLQMFCEDIDLAKDFHKIGGYPMLLPLLETSHEGTRWRAADVCAALVQNNPYCQQMALQDQWLPLLIRLVDNDPAMSVRIKALYAISCLVRQNPEAEQQFSSENGFSVLMRAMQSDVEKLQIKASFLLRNIIESQPKFKDDVCDMGMVEQLVILLQRPHTAVHEHIMAALLYLVDSHRRSVDECRRPQLQLRHLLDNRLAQLGSKQEHQEEADYCKRLLKICFSNSQSSAIDVDR